MALLMLAACKLQDLIEIGDVKQVSLVNAIFLSVIEAKAC
jgi:hypothetical protein